MGRIVVHAPFNVVTLDNGLRYCHIPLLDDIDAKGLKVTCSMVWPEADENGIPQGDAVEVTIDSEDDLSVLDLPDG